MKKGILTLAVLASMSSMAAVAAEEAPDMSDPTAVYTTVGLGYGNAGMDFTSMLLLSSTETQKSGIIFDVKNMFDEDDHAKNPITNRSVHNTSYRLRWGTINTQNGLGATIDAVNLDHPAFGRMTVAQFGTLATLPIGDDFIMFPIAFVGGVLMEDNTLALLDAVLDKKMANVSAADKAAAEAYGAMTDAEKAAYRTSQINAATAGIVAAQEAAKPGSGDPVAASLIATSQVDSKISDAEMLLAIPEARQAAGMTSDGMSMASTIATGMVYARYAFTDKLWALGSYSYTKDIQGKSWSDDVLEGGLEMPSQMYDITVGYQITPTQNITAYYGSDNSSATDDKWKIGYNYAF